MNRFAELLDRLVLTSSRNAKLRLMEDYFRSTADPDRGYALASLAGDLGFATVKPGVLRTLGLERMDPVLFAYSYDYVGDLAETLSLVWPQPQGQGGGHTLRLSDVVQTLQRTSRSDAPAILAALLDRLDTSGRLRSSSWSPAACASASRPGSSSRRSPISAARRWPRSRNSGTGWSHPTNRCSLGSKTRPTGPRSSPGRCSGR
jgi:hypothetical protein